MSWLLASLLYGIGALNDEKSSVSFDLAAANRLHELEKQVGELTNAVQTMRAAVSEMQSASEPTPEGMRRCGHCGSLNEDGIDRCKYCGAEKS